MHTRVKEWKALPTAHDGLSSLTFVAQIHALDAAVLCQVVLFMEGTPDAPKSEPSLNASKLH